MVKLQMDNLKKYLTTEDKVYPSLAWKTYFFFCGFYAFPLHSIVRRTTSQLFMCGTVVSWSTGMPASRARSERFIRPCATTKMHFSS